MSGGRGPVIRMVQRRLSNPFRWFAVQGRMRSVRLTLAAIVAWAAPLIAQTEPLPAVTVVSGTTREGAATELWRTIVRRRLAPHDFDSVAVLVRPLLPEQQEWVALITSRAASWPGAIPPLLTLFPSVAPRPVQVVLGNRGGDDAFTHDSLTIGFDLASLSRTYGPATAEGNSARLDRFFRHEVVHTLQKRWLALHPYNPTAPLEAALLDAWLEGLGNYYSLSPRWYPGADGTPAELTTRALAVLAPRFVARMTALACADSTRAAVLLADLSSGPFEQKWGALPVALWLQQDQQSDTEALKRFVAGGPPVVWQLAHRHLAPALADALESAQNPGHCLHPSPAKPAD